jgi:tetratricopeptide (TPR) repeat protein
VTLDEALARLGAAASVAERCAALEVIARLGDPAVTERVAACLHDDAPEVVALAEATLWQVWGRSGDPAVDALLREGLQAMERRDWLDAVSAFGRVVEAAPRFAEGWNKRATARYLAEHYASAIADCEVVVRLLPQHFGALSGQGLCHMALGQLPEAARCFRQALAIHPKLDGVRENLRRVTQALVRGNGHGGAPD